MARAGLLDVPGDERRPAGAGRALRIDIEPQFRRAPGAGGRTHLVSPAMAAAAGIAGHFVDVRAIALDYFRGENNNEKSIRAADVAALVLTGCNTVQGFGKDVKKVGEVVENAAQGNKFRQGLRVEHRRSGQRNKDHG